LDTPWRDDIAKGEVIFTQKFREVVEEYEEKPKGATIQIPACKL
jgi:hypothetical protein